MKVIVGLGNPGKQYAETRHNVGFMVVEALERRWQASNKERLIDKKSRKVLGFYVECKISEESVKLLMPMTMMNGSGEVLQHLEENSKELLIVCDDVNLPLGVLRMRPKGGAGGHHGIESCIISVGTEEIPRLRVGVGIEKLPTDLSDFLLLPFESGEREKKEKAILRAAEACEAWVKEGIEVTMNRYNTMQEN